MSRLLRLRLHNQQLTSPRHRTPQAVVRSLVALQAQEYAMAMWAIALRLRDAAHDADIERAFDAGRILRTHVLRPTWHFVAPADIRWLLALTAPRVHAANAYMVRQLDLNAAVFRRATAAVVGALRDEENLTRGALQSVLAASGIAAAGPRLAYLLMHAELEGLICSGPRQGKQFTYALLERRAPHAKTLDGDAALAELSRRYFTSRGPASARDFALWSGLTLTQARAGIETLGRTFVRETVAGETFVHARPTVEPRSQTGVTFLMPDYDEYGMSYEDRRALLPDAPRGRQRSPAIAFNRMIIVDGRIAGSWRRDAKGRIETKFAVALTPAKLRAVDAAKQRFTEFLGRPAGSGSRGK
jgi:hypothetical protein